MQDKLTLRKVVDSDCRLIWEWANEAGTRLASFSSKPIPWENHQKWFAARLADAHCCYWIAEDGSGVAVGQVRYQIESQEALVSVSLDAGQRGHGFGSQILSLSAQRLFDQHEIINLIHAYIKPDNILSLRAFTRAGYQFFAQADFQGSPAHHYILHRARN
jgi:UDP-2,4-diacetamido-2,4,6-trideoxy-beta-L-altropyranose hydrolase